MPASLTRSRSPSRMIETTLDSSCGRASASGLPGYSARRGRQKRVEMQHALRQRDRRQIHQVEGVEIGVLDQRRRVSDVLHERAHVDEKLRADRCRDRRRRASASWPSSAWKLASIRDGSSASFSSAASRSARRAEPLAQARLQRAERGEAGGDVRSRLLGRRARLAPDARTPSARRGGRRAAPDSGRPASSSSASRILAVSVRVNSDVESAIGSRNDKQIRRSIRPTDIL